MAVLLVCLFGLASVYADCEDSNILSNGSFEQGDYSPEGSPDDWARTAWKPSAELIWDDTQARSGNNSVRIYAPESNDAAWIQTVDVDPNKLYFLSGWIKTDNLDHAAQSAGGPGATLSLYGTWKHSEGVSGTQDWIRRTLLFNTDSNSQVTIAARLGHHGGTATGSAWFDDLQLRPIVPMDPHPGWKILVLIYQETNFEVKDNSGSTIHHYVASMTQAEMDQAAEAARLFVETDIPVLTSGNMVPEIRVRFPGRALDRLSSMGSGRWWPAPGDTAPERDPEFDSVIVIWEPWVTDLKAADVDKEVWIGAAEGLTWNMGTGQTYASMQLDGAIARGHRNVFKHEWGHSILFYFEAMGTVPQPIVNNHVDLEKPDTVYVHCPSGEPYVWTDETLDHPIPNSIYSNESGFTHDYYSGTTALPADPTHCIGITSAAWALGGPVSHSGNLCDSTGGIEVDLNIFPRTLNLKSRSRSMMVWIKLPAGYTPRDIARDSLELGIPSCPECEDIYPTFGLPLRRSYIAFFPRQDLIDEIEIFDPDLPADLDLEIKGELKDGTPFEGIETIEVIKRKRFTKRR